MIVEKITNIYQLKRIALESNDNTVDCFISLNGGLRSSKEIRYEEDEEWSIFHGISDTWSDYSSDKDFIKDESFLIDAMSKGALYKY